MAGELINLVNVVAPIFLLATAGYVWARSGLPFDNHTISTLVMNLCTPALVFHTLTQSTVTLSALSTMVGAAIAVLATSLIVCLLYLRFTGRAIADYASVMIHSNNGNMGLPLALLAFGEAGLALAVAYFFVNSVSQFTLGTALASGNFSVRRLLTLPIIWAVAAALLAFGLQIPLPEWLLRTTDILGGFVIPAMLLMLGTAIARLKPDDLRSVADLVVVRALIGPAIGLAIIWLFDLSGLAAGVVLLQSAMPAAVFNYVFADKFARAPEQVAAIVLLTTAVSFMALPLVVYLAWQIAA